MNVEDLRGNVRERQIRDDVFFVVTKLFVHDFKQRLWSPREIVVRHHDGFGAAGGARRVDERAAVARTLRLDARRQLHQSKHTHAHNNNVSTHMQHQAARHATMLLT